MAEFLFLALAFASAYYFRSKWFLFAGCGIWALMQMLKPVKIFYFLTLFYPFAYTQFALTGSGGMELSIWNVLLVILLLFVLLRRFVLKDLFGTASDISFPAAVQANFLMVAMFSVAVLLTSFLHGEGISFWVSSVSYALAFAAPLFLVDRPGIFSRTIRLFAGAALILSVSAILSSYGILNLKSLNMTPYGVRRFLGAEYSSTGLIQSRGGFGVNMAFILPFVYLSIAKSIKRAAIRVRNVPEVVVRLSVPAVLGLSIILSGSRATWVMGIVVTILFLTINQFMRNIRNYLGFIAGLIVPSAITLWVFLKGPAVKLFASLYNISPDSVDERIWTNRGAIDSIISNPFFGVPHRQVENLLGLHGTVEIHNFFLYIATENGIMAALLVLFLFICTFRLVFKLWSTSVGETRQMAACMLAGLAGMTASLMFYSGGEKQIWMYLGLMNSFYMSRGSGQHQ
ncbi:MAG: O-antigen ligase family protein [Nitrospiraceae bacterium]|nr:O-antigen ligase family protein [Nitrospiraceae bacterium]